MSPASENGSKSGASGHSNNQSQQDTGNSSFGKSDGNNAINNNTPESQGMSLDDIPF